MSDEAPTSEAAEGVRRRLLEVYGDELPRDAGVLHVASAWVAPDGKLKTLRICEETPRSALDFFLLSVARARADAIVVTGKILRDEPDLRYALPGGEGGALASYRREILGLDEPPRLAVLTSGRAFPSDHPALRGWPRPLVYAPVETHAELRRRLPLGVEIAGQEAIDIRPLIDHLENDLSCRTISIEAGPSTSRALYADPVRVDELMLSLYRGEALEESVRGNALPSLEAIAALLPLTSLPFLREEPDGPWSFHRFTRRRG